MQVDGTTQLEQKHRTNDKTRQIKAKEMFTSNKSDNMPRNLFLTEKVNERPACAFSDFDKDGFDLNEFEQFLHRENGISLNSSLNRCSYQVPWILEPLTSPRIRIDHSYAVARYGYAGKLYDQIKDWSRHDGQLFKLLQLKPKWGFDINLEYVDYVNSTVLDVFHLEEDYFDYSQFITRKHQIELFIAGIDWEKTAHELLANIHEWRNLCGDDENDYKARHVGLKRAYNTLKVI